MQSAIDSDFRNANLNSVKLDVNTVGSRRDVKLAVLFDENMQPIASSNYALLNSFQKELLHQAAFDALKESVEKLHTVVKKESEFVLSGATPILLGSSGKSLKSDRVGVLLIVMDFDDGFYKAEDIVMNQLFLHIGVMIVLATLIALFLHFLVARPVFRLQKTALDFSKGDYKARFSGYAPGEIGVLGESFNAMAKNIEESYCYLRTLLDSQPNIVVVNDGENLIDANRAFFDFFDRYASVEEFRREHHCICEFFEDMDKEGFLNREKNGKNWIDVLHKERDRYHKVAIKKDESNHIFSVYLGVAESSGVVRNIVSFIDITELESIRADLERRVDVEVRKRSDFEEKLLNQSRLAQMGEMVTMISHHWRQPLSIIGMVVQNLKDSYSYGELDEKVLESTEKIVMESVEKLSETLRTLSSYMGKVHNKRVFDASKALTEIAAIVRAELNSEFIEFSVSCEEGIELYGVTTFFGQIIHHLIKNAQEAVLQIDKNDRRIAIEFSKIDANSAKLTVSDNGGGVDEAIVSRIFEPFFTTKDPSSKTGLGLYIVKMLLEQQFGGTIELSLEGDNTSFVLIFPLSKV